MRYALFALFGLGMIAVGAMTDLAAQHYADPLMLIEAMLCCVLGATMVIGAMVASTR